MIFLLLLVTIACNCVQGVRDRLLSAVLLADVAFVRQLVDDYKEGTRNYLLYLVFNVNLNKRDIVCQF